MPCVSKAQKHHRQRQKVEEHTCACFCVDFWNVLEYAYMGSHYGINSKHDCGFGITIHKVSRKQWCDRFKFRRNFHQNRSAHTIPLKRYNVCLYLHLHTVNIPVQWCEKSYGDALSSIQILICSSTLDFDFSKSYDLIRYCTYMYCRHGCTVFVCRLYMHAG